MHRPIYGPACLLTTLRNTEVLFGQLIAQLDSMWREAYTLLPLLRAIAAIRAIKFTQQNILILPENFMALSLNQFLGRAIGLIMPS